MQFNHLFRLDIITAPFKERYRIDLYPYNNDCIIVFKDLIVYSLATIYKSQYNRCLIGHYSKGYIAGFQSYKKVVNDSLGGLSVWFDYKRYFCECNELIIHLNREFPLGIEDAE